MTILFLVANILKQPTLKGLCHELSKGYIWYQLIDIEKIEHWQCLEHLLAQRNLRKSCVSYGRTLANFANCLLNAAANVAEHLSKAFLNNWFSARIPVAAANLQRRFKCPLDISSGNRVYKFSSQIFADRTPNTATNLQRGLAGDWSHWKGVLQHAEVRIL